MMRKDVKLGLAIGGVLLAVVVVYALVGTGSKTSETGGAGIVTEDTSGAGTNSTASAPPRTNELTKAPDPAPAPSTADASKPTHEPTPGGSSTIAAEKPQPPTTAPSMAGSGATDAIASAATGNKPGHDANADLWDKTLNTGELMMSQTPAPVNPNIPGGGVDRRTDDAPAGDKQPHDSAARASGPSTPTHSADRAADRATGSTESHPSYLSTSADPAPSTSSRATTHVVQKDETLALISKAIYGSPNYYPHIIRANPGLDPKKLKPGMTINIPPMSEVKPSSNGEPGSAGGSSTASNGQPIDPHTQYRVEQNDTLERIAIKLYGKREMKDKIAELNKQSLPDPNKLKLHQVLQLPEPPTQTASR